MTINIFNRDCMDAMKEMNDNAFDLAIVDPPYGIGESNGKNHSRGVRAISKKYKIKDWDNTIPPREYFDELRRVSRFQIIWGGNYFLDYLTSTPSFIVWNKINGDNDFADCEIAWTSFRTAVRMFSFRWSGMLQGDMKNKENRIHPTQKPVRLYQWILEKYAKPNWKILDTHIGSGSIAIACHDLGFDLTGYEIDSDYYNDCMKRLNEHQRQLKLFG